MAQKSSQISLTLPVIQLNPRVVYLPGITYRTSFSKDSGYALLARFSKYVNIEELKFSKSQKRLLRSAFEREEEDEKVRHLSDEAMTGCDLFKSQFTRDSVHSSTSNNKQEKWMILGCLPGYEMLERDIKVVTICQILDFVEIGSQLIISFNAMTRGVLSPSAEDMVNESTITINPLPESLKIDKNIDSKVDILLKEVERLFSNITSFVELYEDAVDLTTGNSSTSKDERIRYLLLTLIPIASLLFTSLSSSESVTGLGRLEKLYRLFRADLSKKENSNKRKLENLRGFLTLNDVLCSLFPFSPAQKIDVLASLEIDERLEKVSENIKFANALFEETLNLDFLIQSWKDLDTRQGKRNGDLKRSQFISNHLRSLRALVENMNASSSSKTTTRTTNSSSPRMIGSNGNNDEEENDDLKEIANFIKSIDNYLIAEDGKKLIVKDYKRMKAMQSSSSDYQLLRSYLEIVIDIPWIDIKSEASQTEFKDITLDAAKKQLDLDHYGMDNVKERILEYIAILSLHNRINKRADDNEITTTDEDRDTDVSSGAFVVGESINEEKKVVKREPEKKKSPKAESKVLAKAPILLLSGPPGVGKTSLAKSIATTLGREFQRISLGGLRDESEIKGHRRTYIGALPGLIVQALRRSQVMNPVILLDEIDKVVTGVGASGRSTGDPGAALLEVLDPEQNVNFHDHYIGFPIDLSQVLFVCTANDVWELSDPLRDRMEVIELSGYNYFEKIEICKRYLIPRQIERNGLPKNKNSVVVPDDVILKIATSYTHESGIRTLERLIGSICRSKAIEFSKLLDKNQSIDEFPHGYNPNVSISDLSKYIGVPHDLTKNHKSQTLLSNKYGVVNGLSYNSDGSGSTLVFEMIGVPGSSGISCTGRLGEVLMESCQIANSLIGSVLNDNKLAVNKLPEDENKQLLERYNGLSIHMHVPQGAVSKDGPSAGITMTLCLLSLILEKPVAENIAMTGEITLRGLVLPIGGVKEKLLGAHLTGKITKVLLPRANRKDIISDFIDSVEGMERHQADELLSSLITREEDLLNLAHSFSYEDRCKRLKVFEEPEAWVKEKLGIEIVYVEEFSDVVEAVWGDDVIIRSSELSKHGMRSHL